MSFFEQIRNYFNGAAILKDWLGSAAVPVLPETAQARADICLKCPGNLEGSRLTDEIASAIKEQIELKNHLELHVVGEDGLKACAVCDCVNRLQIWCPEGLFQNHVTKADALRYPAACWKRKMIEAGI